MTVTVNDIDFEKSDLDGLRRSYYELKSGRGKCPDALPDSYEYDTLFMLAIATTYNRLKYWWQKPIITSYDVTRSKYYYMSEITHPQKIKEFYLYLKKEREEITDNTHYGIRTLAMLYFATMFNMKKEWWQKPIIVDYLPIKIPLRIEERAEGGVEIFWKNQKTGNIYSTLED